MVACGHLPPPGLLAPKTIIRRRRRRRHQKQRYFFALSTAFIRTIISDIRQQGQSFSSILCQWEYIIAPLLFTALALFTRLWKIGLSNIVTWDEAQ